MVRKLIHVFLVLAVAVISNTISSKSSQANGCGFTVTGANQIIQFTSAVGSSDSKYLTIWNTSNGPIKLTMSTNSSVFLVDTKEMTLGVGDSMYFKISFVPNAVAPPGTQKTGTLTIGNSLANCTQTISLAGTTSDNPSTGGDSLKLNRTSINFGSLPDDSLACNTVTLLNMSINPVTITSWTLDSTCDSRSSFTVSTTFGQTVTLKSGEFATFDVCYRASNSIPQVSCKLIIQTTKDNVTLSAMTVGLSGSVYGNNGGGGTTDSLKISPSMIEFGAIAADSVVCKTITLINTSKSSIPVTSWTICDNTALKVSSSFGNTTSIAPGQSVTFTVCFSPDAAHPQVGCKLVINYSNGKAFSVGITGSLKGANTSNNPCLIIEQGDAWRDPIVKGTSVDRTLKITNPSGLLVTIFYDSLSCQDVASFNTTATYPITLKAHESTYIPYTFTPQGAANGTVKEKYYACVVFNVQGDSINCDYVKTTLIGYVQGSTNTVDTVVRPLFPDEKRIMAITSKANAPAKTFYFTNNLTVDVTVTGIRLAIGTNFAISATNPASTPFVLKPNDGMSVSIKYIATDNQVHTDTLIIDADHSLASGSEFVLEGSPETSATVHATENATVNVSIVPNPVTTNLTATINGANAAMIEVYDMLGAMVTNASVTNQWNWNTTSNGQHIAAGSYILRFSGIGNDGNPFVISKRIVVR